MTLNDLAIFGNKPAFDTILHVGRPNIGDRAKLHEALDKMLDRKWLTNDGPYVQVLENKVKELLGVKQCVAVANGTLGLEIAARSLFSAGHVIVPSFTFIATASALDWVWLKPVFADIDPRTHVLDPEDVEARITEDTVGILGVHVWGTPCAPLSLEAIAKRHGVKVFFDAAHAFDCQHMGTQIGNFGECEVFSLHATKFFNSFEGGLITTNDCELAVKLRRLRNFGFVGDGTHSVVSAGTNAKMSEIHAAAALVNLESLGEFESQNASNYTYYREWLPEGLRLYPLERASNYQYIVIEVMEGPLTADNLRNILWAENVHARRYFAPPCHKVYRARYNLPNTDLVSSRVLVLPTGMAVERQDIMKICEIIAYCMDNAEEIAERLKNEREVV